MLGILLRLLRLGLQESLAPAGFQKLSNLKCIEARMQQRNTQAAETRGTV